MTGTGAVAIDQCIFVPVRVRPFATVYILHLHSPCRPVEDGEEGEEGEVDDEDLELGELFDALEEVGDCTAVVLYSRSCAATNGSGQPALIA
jgi:hypothetical protein